MRQFFLLLTVSGLGLLAFTSQAGETESKASLSLTDGIVISDKKDEVKNATKESLERHMLETKAEEEGFLSFLNFSFGEKDKTESSQTTLPSEENKNSLNSLYKQAEQGNVQALMNLGYMHLYGQNDLPIDYKKAFEYYNLAAQSGNDVALNNLGSLYYGGVGVAQNIYKAADLFAQASDKGNLEASLNLAIIHLTHQGGLKNEKAALTLIKRAAEKDYPAAQYMLGYAYLYGIGVPQNKKKAVENIRTAADAGYDEAQFIMGRLYENGWGIPQNYNNALKYFSRAFMQGNLSATYELAELYALGNRIEADYYKAYIMYNLASFYGIPKADKKRDILADKKIKKKELLQAQAETENFTPKPSDLTKYIRSTFGESLALYMNKNAPIILGEKGLKFSE